MCRLASYQPFSIISHYGNTLHRITESMSQPVKSILKDGLAERMARARAKCLAASVATFYRIGYNRGPDFAIRKTKWVGWKGKGKEALQSKFGLRLATYLLFHALIEMKPPAKKLSTSPSTRIAMGPLRHISSESIEGIVRAARRHVALGTGNC